MSHAWKTQLIQVLWKIRAEKALIGKFGDCLAVVIQKPLHSLLTSSLTGNALSETTAELYTYKPGQGKPLKEG